MSFIDLSLQQLLMHSTKHAKEYIEQHWNQLMERRYFCYVLLTPKQLQPHGWVIIAATIDALP